MPELLAYCKVTASLNITGDIRMVSQDHAAEALSSVQDTLWDLSHKFIRKYGGDLEEVHQEAQYQFMQAYIRQKDSKAKLNTWVTFRVWYCLVTIVRQQARNNARCSRVHMELGTVPARKGFCRHKLTQGLSDDAEFVVGIALSPPPDLVLGFEVLNRHFERDWHDYDKPVLTRLEAIREYLQEDLGWKEDHIESCFDEIRMVV